MRIGITGSAGMIGWHMRCFLHQFEKVECVCADRETFASDSALQEFVSGCDAIVHFAGMNRGDEEEIEKTNPELAQKLCDACDASQVKPHIVYSNSIHEEHDNFYGRSKRGAAKIFENWSDKNKCGFSNLILPHVFGEGGKPHYNSVVHTFAWQIANNETPKVDKDSELELLHADQVCELAWNCIENSKTGRIQPAGTKIMVSALLERLQRVAGEYQQDVVPNVDDQLDLRLFNMVRSYMFPAAYPRALKLNTDNRGDLFEAIRSNNRGQVFLSTTHPGITRGNHFHFHKIERFLVLRGEARIEIRKMYTDEVSIFDVSGKTPVYIDMPPLHTHNITNTGSEELITLFWAHEFFDPQKPDTVFEMVS